MKSDEGEFWDKRFLAEGEIWGNSPSATATLAAACMSLGAHVLEVGFGYGRDLVYLLRRQYKVTGIDPSREGRRFAENWLQREGLSVESLLLGRFEDSSLAHHGFDMLVCHRMAHLLVAREAIAQFAQKAGQALRPGGYLALGARNADDSNLADMVLVEDKVYEYSHRPGHRIRFWDDAAFQEAFGAEFTIETLSRTVEAESVSKPMPCHLTIMVARKKALKV